MSQTNGHFQSPAALREQIESARLQIELNQLRTEAHQQRLEENWWGGTGWGGVAGDGIFGSGFDPQTPRGWGTPAALIAGNKQGRRDGRNLPFLWTEVNMDFARGQARWLAVENKLAQGALGNLRNYTVRTGYTYEGRPAKGWEQDGTAVEAARILQDVVDEFADLNQWPQRERECLYWSVVDGERFIRSFPQPDGTTLVRDIEPEQVGQPPGHAADPHCLQGIQTDVRDIELPLAYFATYDGLAFETIPAAEVSHLKRNVPRSVKRGLSDFYSTGESLDAVQKLIHNMEVAGGVQAAIAWIEQFAQAGAATASAAAAARRDASRPQTTDPLTGKSPNYQRYQAGSIPLVGGGKEYLPPPVPVGASVHIQIVQAALRAIGARWNMPEYMISGDSSNANYASTLVSGSPFVTAVECEQDIYKTYFLRVLWTAVRNAANHGRFRIAGRILTPEEVEHLCDLHATPPKVAIANKSEEYTVDSGLVKDGAMSLQTLRARHDLDSDQEAANRKKEPPPAAQPPAGQAPPNAGGGQGAGPFFPRLGAG